MRRSCEIAVVVLGLVACRDKPAPSSGSAAASTVTAARPTAPPPAKSAGLPAPTAAAIAKPPPVVVGWDAGKSACVASKDASSPRAGFRPGRNAETGKRNYALRDDGVLEASPKGEATAKTIARARAGTKIAAATFGDHDMVVFLADQKTSEGVMLQAFASIDGQPPVRVSEDGAGATSVDVVALGDKAVIAFIDARSVMVPVHARMTETKDGRVVLGKDAVLFIGGAPDPNVAGILASTEKRAFYILPIARDATSFGMAIVDIDDPPHEDSRVTWSMYPFGLDPAPIAATRGVSPVTLARVVPRDAGLGAPHGIELGRIQDDGTFRTLGLVADGVGPTWLGLELDPAAPKSLTLKYTDGANILTSTLVCPP
jgi:hypothetical protein